MRRRNMCTGTSSLSGRCRVGTALLLAALVPLLTGASAVFTAAPYLQNPSPHSMDVCFQSETHVPATVCYGETSDPDRCVAVSAEPCAGLWGLLYPLPLYGHVQRFVHCAHIDGLAQDTSYFYRVVSDDGKTPVESFRTAAGPDRHFRFAVYGDTRSDFWMGNLGKPNEFHRQVVEAMAAEAPDFILHTGDLVHDGFDFRLWEIWFGITAPLMRQVPLVAVIGNHEDRAEQGVDGREVFETLFVNPSASSGRETYYSFRYGNCHFTVASTDEEFSEGSEQYRWIEGDLAAARSNPEIDFLFMAYHRPGVTSSFRWPDDAGEHKAREVLVPLAEAYGVDVVFNGHEHCYERSFKDHVTYITAGNGGALPTFFGVAEYNPYSEAFYPNPLLNEFGFTLVHVNGNHLRIESILASGEVVDALDLYAADAPPLPAAGGGCGCSVAGRTGFSHSPALTALAMAGLWVLLYGALLSRRRTGLPVRPGKADTAPGLTTIVPADYAIDV